MPDWQGQKLWRECYTKGAAYRLRGTAPARQAGGRTGRLRSSLTTSITT